MRLLKGKYLLGARIASGGMADITHATIIGEGEFRKDACVKLIQSQFTNDPTFRQMFANEAVIAGLLQHANIVQVFDYDRDGDDFFIAMEYVFGKDLRTALNRAAEVGVQVPWALAARVCLDAARGLSAAHRLVGRDNRPLPVVHRDISPHNIMLSFAGEVKITDFGISKLRHSDQNTLYGVIKGKPGYMSPEQANGTDIDVRSDVFSLGIVLWELLTGDRLFDADSAVAIKQAQSGEIPKPSGRRYIPEELQAIAMRALERNRTERYADAGEMADALRDFLIHLTHSPLEESIEPFMASLYPDEKRPARRDGTEVLADDGTEGPATPAPEPVPAGPAEITSTQPDARTRRQKLFAVSAVTTATIIVVALAGWYFKKSAPPPVAPPSSMALNSQPSTLNSQPPARSGRPDGVSLPPSEATDSPKPVPSVCTPSAADSCADPVKPAPAADPPPGPRQKAPAAQAKPTAKTGRLTINANPWADIYLKGKKIGTTPLTNHPLPEGMHKIVLKNPELNAQKEITVRIAADELTTVPVDLLAR